MNNQHVKSLEGLRGWAALLVVLFHLPKWNPILDIGLIDNGHFMVEFFFVLSGFVIYRAYGNSISSFHALLRFQLLRFWRIYPVHFFFLVIFFALELARWFAIKLWSIQDLRIAPFDQNSLVAFVQQLFLVQAIGPTGNAQTFNGPAWSISVEFYTYLIFGLLTLLFRRNAIWGMGVLVLAASWLLNKGVYYEYFLTCILGFFLGCLTGDISRRCRVMEFSWTPDIALIALFGYLQISVEPKLAIVLSLAIILVLALAYSQTGYTVDLLEARISQWLGKISYSLYMAHALIIWLTSVLLKRGLSLTESLRADGKWVLDLNVPQALMASILAIGLSLLVSHSICKYIEQPIRNWSRRDAK